MEEYVVNLQTRLSNRISISNSSVHTVLSARLNLLIPVKAYATFRDNVSLPLSLTTPQSHPQVNIPLFLITNPSTPSRNRLLFSEINLCPLYVPLANPIPTANTTLVLLHLPHRNKNFAPRLLWTNLRSYKRKANDYDWHPILDAAGGCHTQGVWPESGYMVSWDCSSSACVRTILGHHPCYFSY
jgi:hypothetical protein